MIADFIKSKTRLMVHDGLKGKKTIYAPSKVTWFMKKETIVNMLDKIKSKEYDSSFTGIAIKNFCWFESKPLNYDLGKNIPWTQNLTPVIKETSSLYIFKKDDFLSSGRRIGFKPYIKIVDPMEGHDIDYQYEFTLAKKILEGEI